MVKAIRVHEYGHPRVLKWEEVEIGEPKEAQIKVKNKAIALNFVDICFRKGIYPASNLPFIPGMEGAGEVIAVGPGVTTPKIGDHIAYISDTMGAYAHEIILPVDSIVPLPSFIDPILAASVMCKGMTAHFLLHQCFKVQEGQTVLIHAAAGGVGSLLCQWANALGAMVIGTVSTNDKALQAKDDGCHHVVLYKEDDFVARVHVITSGKGVDVVYDSVGKDTFKGSLTCLKVRGCMVSYGESSGTPEPISLSTIVAKSLVVTRPSLTDYLVTREEILQNASRVFNNVNTGILRVHVNHVYPLSQVAQAHEDLESRKTSGSIVLVPDGC